MNLNDFVAFIPVSDVESYIEWDDQYGGVDQIDVGGGIVVSSAREEPCSRIREVDSGTIVERCGMLWNIMACPQPTIL